MMCLLIIGTISSTTAYAQTSWTNAAGGNWSTAANWVPGVLPGPGTNAYFTNSTPVSYTVTNNILNNTFGDLTAYRAGLLATIYSATDGFNPNGNAVIGSGGRLLITNSTATIGGSMTISNLARLLVMDGANVTVNGILNNAYGLWIQGTNTVLSVLGGGINTAASGYPYLFTAPTDLQFFNNGTLNIGGTSAAGANNSLVTFTNAGSLTINGYNNGYVGSSSGVTNATINASTNGVGFYNNGTISSYLGYGGLNLNGTLVNGTSGILDPGPYGAQYFIERFTTNRGKVILWNSGTSLTVNKGDFVNQGFVRLEANAFKILDGSFINDTNGLLGMTSLFNGSVQAKSMLNRGTIALTNGYAGGFTITGVLTNEGLFSLYRYDYGFGRNTYSGFSASNIVNSGTIMALGQTNVFSPDPKKAVLNWIVNPVTNLASGVITTTNGAFLGLGYYGSGVAPKSYGTFLVNADSTIGIGASANGYYYDSIFYFGYNGYRNEGTIDLRGGAFGVAHLTNAPGATVKGYGDIGVLIYSNMVSGSLLSTNLARYASVRPIANQGTINVGGDLNAGAITNLSGGLITGSGAVVSFNTTNYYVGETLTTDKQYTGARILNNAGASILASGGALVLSNGLVANSSAGTLGGTNGGILQLGDGTLALTNNGAIKLWGGGLTVGSLRNNGSIQLLNGGPNSLSVGGALTLASATTLSASNSASFVSGTVTNLGTIQVVNSTITFSNKVFGSGRYISDPSTNTFVDDVTIAPSGTLEGGLGDMFDFKKNLFINSTNTMQFNLWISTVSFSGGGDHTNAITGLDFDNGPTFGETHGYRSTNFAYGTLKLGASDSLYLVDGDGIPSNTNGLYLSVLDIGGSTNDLARLHTPFNIYYRNGAPGNEFLGGLTYALDGGGLLIAVPEPSTVLLLLTALAAFARSRSRR